MKHVVIVADDPQAVQENRFALRHATAFRVIATVDGRGSARAELARLQPELVVVNDMCQRTNVTARIREAREEAPGARIVVLSGRMDATGADDAFAAGAHAVISRSLHPLALGLLLREVAQGNVLHAPSAALAPAGATPAPALRLVPGHEAPAARTSA
jgi:DNA-binding NarL/FixJ family response regulator